MKQIVQESILRIPICRWQQSCTGWVAAFHGLRVVASTPGRVTGESRDDACALDQKEAIQGLRNDVIVRDDIARRLFPQIEPLDYASAVRLALANLETGQVETAWSDALSSSQGDVLPVVLTTQVTVSRFLPD